MVELTPHGKEGEPLYLKTLILHGFKSFPDKTVIEFDRGITCIVGPNGSGKSNISDSVRWVLGEMSPKSLRGSKMEDVIFGGTSLRRPAGYAEVTLVLDNTDRRSSFDADEIAVCRRLYRSGDSEYIVNNRQVRLKDVVDLFLNTGIGKEGYSVIGQGKITEVISQKGEERRNIFEEAAGISKLRYKKREAAAKLDATSGNLLRISDLLNEIESRLPSLERQAEKAKAYLVLQQERRKLEVESCVKRLSASDGSLNGLRESRDGQERRLTELDAAAEKLRQALSALYLETQKNKLSLLREQGEKDTLSGLLNETTAELSVWENDIRHYEGQIAQSQRETASFLEKAAQFSEQIDEVSGQTEQARAEIAKKAETIERTRESIQSLREEENRLRAREEQAQDGLRVLRDSKSSGDLIIREGESYNRAREERLLAVQNELALQESGLRAQERVLAECETRQDALSASLAELNARQDAQREQAEEAARLESETGEQRQRIRLQLLERNQRKETLVRMDRLLEGFSGSVKAVMSAAGRELPGIHGPVSKLFQTDPAYITAMETALGGGMQNIVVDTEADAKAAIRYLKQTNAGRATFLPLSTVTAQEFGDAALKGMPGYLGIASDLVRCEPVYAVIMKQLLGRTAVADHIDNAALLAAKTQYKCRVVTLDGQVIHPGGSFTGGQSLKSSGILSRRNDIDRLSAEAAKLQAEAERLALSLSETAKKRAAAQGLLLELEREEELLRARSRETAGLRTLTLQRIEDIKARADALRQEHASLAGSAGVTKDSLAKTLAENDALARRIAGEEQALLTLVRQREEARRSAAEREEALLLLIGEKSSLEGELTRLSERESGLRAQHVFHERQAREKERSAGEQAEEVRQIRTRIAAGLLRKRELEKQILEAGARLDSGKAREEEYELQSLHLRAAEKTNGEEKETAYKLHTQLQVRIGALENERALIGQKLLEEYEMDEEQARLFAAASPAEGYRDDAEKEARLTELKRQIKHLGAVNPESIPEYDREKERFDFMTAQYGDAQSAKESLEKMIVSLENTMREMFEESLKHIQECFGETFAELFGGGSAEIVVTGDDLLDCSVDIRAQPPGKTVKSLSLLSGGEQSIVAIALYLAILKVSPSPFCVFDEIEAALDDTNIARFGEYLLRYSAGTQYILITHRRGTMEIADTLYGITMQEKGVSDFIKINLNEYKEED